MANFQNPSKAQNMTLPPRVGRVTTKPLFKQSYVGPITVATAQNFKSVKDTHRYGGDFTDLKLCLYCDENRPELANAVLEYRSSLRVPKGFLKMILILDFGTQLSESQCMACTEGDTLVVYLNLLHHPHPEDYSAVELLGSILSRISSK